MSPKAKSTKCMMSTPSKYAEYLRVSTEDQANNGYGLDVQRVKCDAMGTVKGWQFVAVYTDDGVSGTKGADERPGLAQMLADAKDGKFDALIVSALDRLGRKTKLVLDLVDELTSYGVSLVSCKESLDTTSPTGQFVLSMFAALAQLERDTIVARTSDGREERAKIDGERGGRVPLGYLRTDEGIAIDETGAAIVRRVFAMREKDKTLKQIASDLNADGVTTSRGRQWHASSVREILLNESDYRGGSRGGSGVNWPTILDD
jgi:site-specific DNA recombinase